MAIYYSSSKIRDQEVQNQFSILVPFNTKFKQFLQKVVNPKNGPPAPGLFFRPPEFENCPMGPENGPSGNTASEYLHNFQYNCT